MKNKKIRVNTIKLFLNEPVIEFERPDGGHSIKTASLLDEEEQHLAIDVICNRVLPKLGAENTNYFYGDLPKDIPFCVNLKREMNCSNISIDELAKGTGVTSRYIRYLVDGVKDNPSLKLIKKIAKVLNCRVSDLV